MSDKNIISAVDRLFRAYDEYTADSSEDTLFLLLTALHSLDDRLGTTKGRLDLTRFHGHCELAH